jgi:D-3-phosphoglycerate dehydrogenase
VLHTPARNAQAVAEMFIANVVSFLRHTLPAVQWLESAQWKEGAQSSYLEFKGNELAGKIVGMVGFGAIGQTIARLLKPWPCEIRYYDPFLEAAIAGCTETSLENIFETCDIVSIHLPANKDTAGIIGKKLLSRMKRDAIFVNTSRSMVVNQDDLLEVLEDKRIRGAVIDVFDHEPPDARDYKLIRLDNVLATPHIAGATFEVEDHHVDILNRQLLSWHDKIHAFHEPSGNGLKNDKHSK